MTAQIVEATIEGEEILLTQWPVFGTQMPLCFYSDYDIGAQLANKRTVNLTVDGSTFTYFVHRWEVLPGILGCLSDYRLMVDVINQGMGDEYKRGT
jgi:hypothetical protein